MQLAARARLASFPLTAIGICTLLLLSALHPASAQEPRSLSAPDLRTASAPDLRPALAPSQVSIPAAPHSLSLEPLTDQELAAQVLIADEHIHPNVPANFREFGTVRAGQFAQPRRLTFRFAAAARLTRIESTPDFTLEQGGSCVEGNDYAANAACTLMVRFTPQGPGRRTGKLAISTSADLTPLAVGIGGYGSAPAISFTPSIISTVPGTYVSGAGLLSGASNLAVDGGDALYMADTGNQLVRYLGSNNTLQNIAFDYTLTDPEGIAVDSFDSVYVSQDNPATLLLGFEAGISTEYSTGTTSCSFGTTCALQGAPLDVPGAIAVDPNGNVFLSVLDEAYELIDTSEIYSKNYIPLADGFNYSSAAYSLPGPLAVDGSDSIYAYDNNSAACFISSISYYYASTQSYSGVVNIAGGRGCGFSGDGGQARSALIGTSVGQMTFDIAGNFYFSDTSNNRVRRIDKSTGIITTIAGDGVVGYGGDGGPATSATLNTPTGVAVDSQGQVYIISRPSTANATQVVRKVGTVGALNLGSASVGAPSVAQTITVANTGNADLDFVHTGFSSGNTTDFTIDPYTTNCVFTAPLASGSSCRIGFIFNPAAAGARSAVFTITDNTLAVTNTIQLTGTGYTAATLTPSSFSFASTAVGSPSASQTATLTNTGKAVMTITSIAFSGTGATSYTDTTTCGTTLAVGASCTIAVTFNPTTTGSLPATLTVTDNAVTIHQTAALTGTGLAGAKAALSPTSAAFGNQTVSTASAAKVLTLTNSGGASLTISSYTFTGTNATDFTQTHTCGTTLAAAANCTISITFKPAATGARTGTLTIATTGGSVAAALTGTGTAAAAKAALTPASSSFIDQAVATPSAPKTLTLTNSAATPLTITSWNMTGPNATEFAQTHTCGVTLAPAASCSVSLVFTPSAAGTRSATLTAATSSGPIAATISGAAVAVPTATLSSDSLVFPTTNLGSTSASQTLTLTNTGASALVISSITLSGADAASFPHTTTCTSTLAIGASCTITVSFSPIAGGYNRVTLNVTDNTAILHQDVALSGTGSSAAISATLSPGILTFSTPAGSTSPSQTLTLANTGAAVITTSSITVSGTDAALFLKSTTCGLTLPTGANCTITVSFAPTAEANSHATLSVTDNTTIVHQNVALVGSATTPPVSVGPPTITFPGTIVRATSAPQALQIFSNRGYPIPTPTITFSGANPQSFSSATTCGATFLPNDQCVFSVSFTPTAVGPQSASLIVTSTDGTSVVQQSVPVSGVGITGAVSAMLTSTVSATSPRA